MNKYTDAELTLRAVGSGKSIWRYLGATKTLPDKFYVFDVYDPHGWIQTRTVLKSNLWP